MTATNDLKKDTEEELRTVFSRLFYPDLFRKTENIVDEKFQNLKTVFSAENNSIYNVVDDIKSICKDFDDKLDNTSQKILNLQNSLKEIKMEDIHLLHSKIEDIKQIISDNNSNIAFVSKLITDLPERIRSYFAEEYQRKQVASQNAMNDKIAHMIKVSKYTFILSISMVIIMLIVLIKIFF